MKKIILLFMAVVLYGTILSACEGDCVLCHPKLTELEGDLVKEHAVLSTCKTCHTQEEMEKIDMGNGCGDDCWDCHDINKVTASNVPQHKGLQKCIDCHVSINKNMWGGKELSTDASTMPTLDELMQQDKSSEKSSISKEAIVKIDKELNKSVSVDMGSELTIWAKIGNFFSSLWQKILTIFA